MNLAAKYIENHLNNKSSVLWHKSFIFLCTEMGVKLFAERQINPRNAPISFISNRAVIDIYNTYQNEVLSPIIYNERIYLSIDENRLFPAQQLIIISFTID